MLLFGCQPIQPEGGAAPVAAAPAAEEPMAEAPAQAGPAASDALVGVLPELTVAITADGIVVPAEVPAGPTIINLVNETGAMSEEGSPVLPDLGRLTEGATEAAVLEAAAMANENPGPALELIKLYGTKIVPTGRVIFDLQPGPHMALTTGAENMGASFEVVENAEPAVVEPDVEVQLMDFSFVMPDVIAAGPQLWQIENIGGQWHEIIVIKPTQAMTTEELMAAIMSEEMEGPPPFDVPFGYVVISEGNRAFVDVELTPGEYTVICFLPDLMGDMSPHALHGMVRTLTVE